MSLLDDPEILALFATRLSGGIDAEYDAALILDFCKNFNVSPREVRAGLKNLNRAISGVSA